VRPLNNFIWSCCNSN